MRITKSYVDSPAASRGVHQLRKASLYNADIHIATKINQHENTTQKVRVRYKPESFPYCGNSSVMYFFFFFFFFLAHFYFPASGQAVVTGAIPSPPLCLPSIFIAHRVQQSHCSSIVHRMLLTHALALSASQFVHKKKSQRIYTSSMHSAGLELTKLTNTRLEDNLIRHRGDRLLPLISPVGSYQRHSQAQNQPLSKYNRTSVDY